MMTKAELDRLFAENAVRPCAQAGCSIPRWALNKCCEQHATERQKIRSDAARRAIETRRRNHPEWGKPSDAKSFDVWRTRAGSMVAFAISKGVLPSLATDEYACADCGGVACEYDHRDYAKPLDVVPVCRRCNILRGSAAWPHPGRYKFRKVAPAPSSKEAA